MTHALAAAAGIVTGMALWHSAGLWFLRWVFRRQPGTYLGPLLRNLPPDAFTRLARNVEEERARRARLYRNELEREDQS